MNIIKSSKILESVAKTGNRKFWQCHISNNGSKYFTLTSFWQINKAGEKSIVQFAEPYEVLAKNVGRANEVTVKEQAELEFERMFTKQIDKGYHLEGETSEVLPQPMLAHKFKDKSSKLTYPLFVQRKYNGQRMLYDGDQGWSRGGKVIIPEVIEHLGFNTKGHIIDGELMLPGNQRLQESMKAIKKYRPELSSQLLYIIYDVIDDSPYHIRQKILQTLKLPNNVIVAPTYLVENEAEVMKYHKAFAKEGFEGIMVRAYESKYESGKRSNELLKYKAFSDGEYEIVNVIEGDGKFKGAAIFVCKTKKGIEFNCTPEGEMDYRRELYENRKQHIGKMLTIRYMDLSKDDVPQHLVGVGIREDDE